LATVAGFLLFVIAATTVSQVPDETNPQPWVISERKLPAPAAASEVLRTLLLNTPRPDAAAMRQNAPQSEAELRQLVDLRNTETAKFAKSLAAQLSVSIESGEIAGVPVFWVAPADVASQHSNHLFIHVHGGAYMIGGGEAAVAEAVLIADRVKIPVLSIDYRMPPTHPFPAALNDVISVYKQLLKTYSAKSLALGGTSAGGGLALASTHKIIELGLELPAALFAGTPWADLTKTSDSLFTNEGIDRTLVTYDADLARAAQLYVGNGDIRNPLISPLYGDFKKFPPTYFVTGTRDLFLSDTVRTHRKMRLAGIDAELNVYEGLSHAEYAVLVDSPESQQAYGELGLFLSKHLK
jgi:acetyl esterase/lipase